MNQPGDLPAEAPGAGEPTDRWLKPPVTATPAPTRGAGQTLDVRVRPKERRWQATVRNLAILTRILAGSCTGNASASATTVGARHAQAVFVTGPLDVSARRSMFAQAGSCSARRSLRPRTPSLA